MYSCRYISQRSSWLAHGKLVRHSLFIIKRGNRLGCSNLKASTPRPHATKISRSCGVSECRCVSDSVHSSAVLIDGFVKWHVTLRTIPSGASIIQITCLRMQHRGVAGRLVRYLPLHSILIRLGDIAEISPLNGNDRNDSHKANPGSPQAAFRTSDEISKISFP
jgi:hypothetical protein